MASMATGLDIHVPSVPAKHDQFIQYVAAHPDTPMMDLLDPYKQYDTELRKVFAQQPDHPAVKQPNIVTIFAGHEQDVKVRARSLKTETTQEKESYIMPLKHQDRKPNGSPAIVQSLRDFKTNFNVFSESSLVDLDWSNVVVAGSAVVTSLLAVPGKHAGSKRALREYYHEQLAPASDVDLFFYGLTEEQAIEKIKQIERNIRDALLVETTTVRTKNAITIASQYPTRHVQIVLRIYKSISEILTGFDVDCSCAAYDGKQVYASPRALAAYMTQINTIDLTRRSPSYENRLSKYAKRGFEVYWPNLERSKIDPTIFERSFGRTEGLARLLILEKLPKSQDREDYLDQRRAERGRPPINRWRMRKRQVHGDIKGNYEDEVAEWVDTDEVSNYNTFTLPYGPKIHARKIEKLIYTKDMLLNAEWNKPKEREVNLHRHPAFFGTTDDVIHDCCGFCPEPSTIEEEEVAENEDKVYVKGDISFIKDDAGRQAIGSFNPLSAEDWTEMAYVSKTGMLCQAIVDGDVEYVRSWLQHDGNDPNARDWTGRTPLHLAVVNSPVEIVQLLIDNGARLVARLVDGKTALHLAAIRGSVEIVTALLRKSEANEEDEEKKVDARTAARKAAKDGTAADVKMTTPAPDEPSDGESDVVMLDDDVEDEDMDATTENSMVNIRSPGPEADDKALANDEDNDEPDVYDVNVLAWDTAASALHYAIICGHIDVVSTLVQDFGADLLLPIKLFNDHDKSARAAILTLVLALQLPMKKAEEMTRALIRLGASSAQADMDQVTVLQYSIADRPDQIDTLVDADKTGVTRAINHLSVSGYKWSPQISGPLLTAIQARDSLTALRLLSAGAKPQIEFPEYMKAYRTRHETISDTEQNRRNFETSCEQPVLTALRCEMPLLVKTFVEEHGVDPNTFTTAGYQVLQAAQYRSYTRGQTLLDLVKDRLSRLRAWKPQEEVPELPKALQDDDAYLEAYKERPYALWSARKQLDAAKVTYNDAVEVRKQQIERAENKTGLEEKKAVIDAMIASYEELETTLVTKQAKTFAELHPDIPEPEQYHSRMHRFARPEPKEFEVSFVFKLPDVVDETHERYLELFEAAWSGDVRTVKMLTLASWKSSKNEDQKPLQIAVQDQHQLSPFSIAVMHGHFDVATAIMEIAAAQYVQPDAQKQHRYGLDADDDASETSDRSDDEVQLYSEIVDDEFTIETIGEVSMQVKSRVKPLSMMAWNCPVSAVYEAQHSTDSNCFSYFGPRKPYTMVGKRTNTASVKPASPPEAIVARWAEVGRPQNLIQLALFNSDYQLLVYLLSMGQSYLQVEHAGVEDDEKQHFFTISDADFHYALKAGTTDLVEEIIKRSGAGIPLNDFVKRSGIELNRKPKYYQGLSVHGKKRRDWADRSRTHMSNEPIENHRPPSLEAIHRGSLKLAEWLMSDAPMRCYKEFAEANKGDVRLVRLAEGAGFEAATSKFLNARSHLAIHCCLMGINTEDKDSMLRYLVSALPNAVNAKSGDGLTPLHIAFELCDTAAVKIFTDAGADHTVRDRSGNNLIHRLLIRQVRSDQHVRKLSQMLDLIDKRILSSMFVERSSEHPGSLTPLAKWLNLAGGLYTRKQEADTLRTILQYSQGEELGIINGEGDTPLHVCVRRQLTHLAEVIVRFDPSLVNRENATGRTPFEMAEDAAIAAVCSDPPPLPHDHRFFTRRAQRFGLPLDWNNDVINRQPETFVHKVGEDRRDGREQIWDLVRETKRKLDAEGQPKRRIVTLNEANEVARRLAAKKAGVDRSTYESSVGERVNDAPAGGDEVQAWLGSARIRVEEELQ